MAKKTNKKNPKEASTTFLNIIKASVKPTIKPKTNETSKKRVKSDNLINNCE